MGVYIEGMEMPDGCFHCILSFMYFNGTENVLRCNVLKKLVSDDGTKDTNCPLIEVPPHGRLIDADAVERNLVKMQMAQKGVIGHGIRKSRAVVRDMVTVIPADKDSET